MPDAAATYDPVVGLLTAAVLVALLTMTLRRLNRSMRTFLPRPAPPEPPDYGLLVPVATVPTTADAEMMREVLAAHGIRATVAPAVDMAPGAGRDTAGRRATGRASLCVLVFPDDAARARDVLATR